MNVTDVQALLDDYAGQGVNVSMLKPGAEPTLLSLQDARWTVMGTGLWAEDRNGRLVVAMHPVYLEAETRWEIRSIQRVEAGLLVETEDGWDLLITKAQMTGALALRLEGQ